MPLGAADLLRGRRYRESGVAVVPTDLGHALGGEALRLLEAGSNGIAGHARSLLERRRRGHVLIEPAQLLVALPSSLSSEDVSSPEADQYAESHVLPPMS